MLTGSRTTLRLASATSLPGFIDGGFLSECCTYHNDSDLQLVRTKVYCNDVTGGRYVPRSTHGSRARNHGTAFTQGCLDSCSGWIILQRSLHQGYRTHRFRFGCGEERSRGSRFIVPFSCQWYWLRYGNSSVLEGSRREPRPHEGDVLHDPVTEGFPALWFSCTT